ncbi:hypothetical protein JCM12298_29440 [Desulfothermus naphthae]
MFYLRFGIFLFLFVIGCFSSIHPSNFCPNGSFEITTVPDIPDCWDQYLGPKKIKGWYSFWKVDKNMSFHGKNSLNIIVPNKSLVGNLYAESCFSDWLIRKRKWKRLKKNKFYVLSLYMKSDRPSFPVKIRFQKDYYVKVTTHWKRYYFRTFLTYKEKFGAIRITPMGIGKLWIDAVQLEPGVSPSKFKPSIYDSNLSKMPKPLSVDKVHKRIYKIGWKENFGDVKLNELKENGACPVKVDSERRCLLVNRKPFFFFAACFMRAHLYKTRWKELLNILKEHGYTTVIASFSCRWNNSHASLPEIRSFLHLAYRYGLKVIIWINPNAIRDKNGKFRPVKKYFPPEIVLREYKKEIKRIIVPLLKNHPALLGWYLCDEPCKKSLIRSGFTKKIIEFARKFDNCHPLYINYGNLLEDYKFYKGEVPGDIVSHTQYPIPVYPITYIAENTAFECVTGEFKKPVVLWLQLWGGKGRYPTPDEFSCMAYLAAIYGATGFQTWPMMPGSKLLWNRVKVVISEMKELAPVLYEPVRFPIELKGSEYVHAMAKKVNGKYWIIAVNTLNKPQKITIKVLSIKNISHVEVKFENRICDYKKNYFEDNFKPYERHVYKIE